MLNRHQSVPPVIHNLVFFRDAHLALLQPDFIGRRAVLTQQGQQPEWRFIKLLVDSTAADPLSGDPIPLDGECVGYVTSGGSGFRTGQCLALGYISLAAGNSSANNSSSSTSGTNDPASGFAIEILGEARPATVVQHAFYDPDNQRLRS